MQRILCNRRAIAGVMVGLALGLTGCGDSLYYTKAKTLNTPEAYAKFLMVGKGSAKEYTEARERLVALYSQRAIRRVQVCFLDWDDRDFAKQQGYHPWDGGFGTNRAMSHGLRVFEGILRKRVEHELKDKGYTVTLGGQIYVTKEDRGLRKMYTDTGFRAMTGFRMKGNQESVRDIPYGRMMKGGYLYYYCIEPFLKSLNWDDADAICVVAMSRLNYVWNESPGSWDTSRSETQHVERVTMSYYLFDLKAKELVFGKEVGTLRQSNVVHPATPGYPFATIGWQAADVFWDRAIQRLFEDLPPAGS